MDDQKERIELLNKYKLILALLPVLVLMLFYVLVVGVNIHFLLLINTLVVYGLGVGLLSRQEIQKRVFYALLLLVVCFLGMVIIFMIYFNGVVISVF